MVLNNGQRCQINFLEQLPTIIVTSLASGINYPFLTFCLLIAYSVARLMYSFGYMISPSYRLPGALLQDGVVVGLLVLAYKSASKIL